MTAFGCNVFAQNNDPLTKQNKKLNRLASYKIRNRDKQLHVNGNPVKDQAISEYVQHLLAAVLSETHQH
jgi:hypothetical protein